ncbi:MAG: hypothetical protein XXXJIFNMEKO3_00629 [Candidatus Erwinia impunctatus]
MTILTLRDYETQVAEAMAMVDVLKDDASRYTASEKGRILFKPGLFKKCRQRTQFLVTTSKKKHEREKTFLLFYVNISQS